MSATPAIRSSQYVWIETQLVCSCLKFDISAFASHLILWVTFFSQKNLQNFKLWFAQYHSRIRQNDARDMFRPPPPYSNPRNNNHGSFLSSYYHHPQPSEPRCTRKAAGTLWIDYSTLAPRIMRDWLIGCLVGSLIDWSIDWLIDCLIDWLIEYDWVVNWRLDSSQFHVQLASDFCCTFWRSWKNNWDWKTNTALENKPKYAETQKGKDRLLSTFFKGYVNPQGG